MQVVSVDEPLEEDSEDDVLPEPSETDTENDIIVLEESTVVSPAPVLTTTAPEAESEC